jgi:hypothetical protein
VRARKEAPALEPVVTGPRGAAARILDGYARLRSALLGGAATAPIRAEIGALQRAAAAEAAAKASVEAEREEREAAEIGANARQIADGVAIRLAARMVALQPPPAPVR